LAGNKLDPTHLKYALFLTSLVKGMMAVFQPGCEQLGYPRVSNLRFRPIPKHLAGTPIIIVVEDGTGETGSGCPSKVEVPTRLLRCQRNVLSNVVVVSELKRLELQNDLWALLKLPRVHHAGGRQLPESASQTSPAFAHAHTNRHLSLIIM
jgi:hypothetical protein